MMRPFPHLPTPASLWHSVIIRILVTLAIVVVVVALLYSFVFGPAGATTSSSEEFIVNPDETLGEATAALGAQGLVRHEWAFAFAAFISGTPTRLREGGYILSRGMDVFTLLSTLSDAPYLAWVTVPDGLRKEQIAALLKNTLNWNDEETQAWLDNKSVLPEFTDGVYFPGTYLIPSDMQPSAVANQMRSKFQDQLAPYAEEANTLGKSWADVITLASLIERESAKSDKALVAGILTNRLKKNMALQVDATLQYMEGTASNHWWPAPNPDDKDIDSHFNTYKYAGLPPQPIATPSLDSIEAVLHPATTSCLFYLHDNNGKIHCSPTYAGHIANIKKYL